MDSDDMKFRIIYDGPALDNHEMEVRDLAPALLALSEVFEEANKTIYGKGTVVSVKVNASFKAGSFGVDLIASSSSIAQNLIGMFSGSTASAACNIISLVGFGFLLGGKVKNGLIQLITWMDGRKLKSIHPLPDGNVKVFIDDEEQVFEEQVVELYKNYKLRQSLEDLISKPLEKDGIDSFAVTIDEGKSFVSINRKQSVLFKVDRPDDKKISESISVKALQLIDISFDEGHKWRFNDGSSTFHATVSDQDFIHAIDAQSVNFAKGDILMVELRITQHLQVGGIKTSYEVIKVKDIINPSRQIDLPFE